MYFLKLLPAIVTYINLVVLQRRVCARGRSVIDRLPPELGWMHVWLLPQPGSHLKVHNSESASGSLRLKDAIYCEAILFYSQGNFIVLYLWKLSMCLSQNAIIWKKQTNTEGTPCLQSHFIKGKLDWKNDSPKCIFNRLLSKMHFQ